LKVRYNGQENEKYCVKPKQVINDQTEILKKYWKQKEEALHPISDKRPLEDTT